MAITTVSRNKCFGGIQAVYSHESRETGSVMRFGLRRLVHREAHLQSDFRRSMRVVALHAAEGLMFAYRLHWYLRWV